MSFSIVRFLCGNILIGLAVLMLAPCILSVYLHSANVMPFFASEAITAATAILLIASKGRTPNRLWVREVFLLTVLAWILVCVFGALPFIFSHTVTHFVDAVFESVSGVTTTGATILNGLDSQPRDILLWRSMMQWVGGLGIVALGAAVLPFLRIGGMRLFRAESSDFSEKALPHTRRFLVRLLLIYVGMSAACAASYAAFGMGTFDAINHAMTTVSTGGFSTHNASLAYFDSLAIEIVAVIFMLIAAAPFVMFLPLMSGNLRQIRTDGQARSMVGSYALVVASLIVWLTWNRDVGFAEALRISAFNVVSIGTTTGYVSDDYSNWGTFAIVVFFFLTFVGGCSGSTSGGIKIFRFKIAFIMFRETMQRLLHPNAVFTRSINGRPVTDDIVSSVVAFALAFACTVSIVTILLAAAGNDFITSFSAAGTAIANVGPGMGSVIGPVSNFATLSDASKWILCAAMLLGRLEIFTLLIVLTPTFWRG
jgi:trk/ktr system potassium uptake protein